MNSTNMIGVVIVGEIHQFSFENICFLWLVFETPQKEI